MPRSYRSSFRNRGGRESPYNLRRRRWVPWVQNNYITNNTRSSLVETGDGSRSQISIDSSTISVEATNSSVNQTNALGLSQANSTRDRSRPRSYRARRPRTDFARTAGSRVNVNFNEILEEYATKGRPRQGDSDIEKVVGELRKAESSAERNEMDLALDILRNASASVKALSLDPGMVSTLAKKSTNSVRSAVLYFCAAQSGSSGISTYILEVGKAFDKGEENANTLIMKFGLPLMEEMLKGIRGVGNSGVVERAFALNWIAFSCNDIGEFGKAIAHAEDAIGSMDENFGRNASPQYQVYSRLLLTAGEAFHKMKDYRKAATYLKRASLTVSMAKDFRPTQKRILQEKIKKIRKINNRALRGLL